MKVSCYCSKSDLVSVERCWNRIAAQKRDVYEGVLDDVAKYDENVAQSMRSGYLKVAGSLTAAAVEFFNDVDFIFYTFPNFMLLKNQVEYTAVYHTDLARTVYRNAPLICTRPLVN